MRDGSTTGRGGPSRTERVGDGTATAAGEPARAGDRVGRLPLSLHVRMGSRRIGGADRSLSYVAAGFESLGAPFRIAIVDDGRTDWKPLQSLFADLPSRLQCVKVSHRFDPRGPLRLARLARELKVDVIHAVDYKADALAAVASRLARVPWVATLHGTPGASLRLHAYRAIDRLAVKSAARRFVVSSTLARSGGGASRTELVPNVVPVPDAPLRRCVDAPRRLITVCRLEPEKNIAGLLRALTISRRQVPDLTLAIVGDGSCRLELERQTAALGLEHVVRFTGWVADPTPFLDHADLFVLASVEDQQPLALLEAMARGLPAVATAVGEVPRLLDQGVTGLVVAPGDDQALASALVTAASSSFDVAAGWARIRQAHAPERLASIYLEAYRQLLGAAVGGGDHGSGAT